METKKPWAIDLEYFTPVGKAVYLHDVASPRSDTRSIEVSRSLTTSSCCSRPVRYSVSASPWTICPPTSVSTERTLLIASSGTARASK
jgi:hypothetical protein